MTIKEFRKLCKEHNAMDYAMVIANSRLKKEYPITIKNLKVNEDSEDIYALFSSKDKNEYWTTDCVTVKDFLKWSGGFGAYHISPADISTNIVFGWILERDVRFYDNDEVVSLFIF